MKPKVVEVGHALACPHGASRQSGEGKLKHAPPIALWAILPAACSLLPAQTPASLTVDSPREFQVVQRQSKALGTVSVSGRALAPCDRAEARFTGSSTSGELPGSWQG